MIPKIDLRPTPQNIQDRRRTELLLEIEEDQARVPERIRKLISDQKTLPTLVQVTRKLNEEYASGRLSDKLLKRCGTWVARKVEELRVHKETH